MTYPTFEEVAVVGMHFRPNGKAIVESLIAPCSFDLEREPFNPYDGFAVKVLYDGEHIGYIEKQVAMFLAPWLDQGAVYTCIANDFRQNRNNVHPIVTLEPVEENDE
jgi:hypothetical protein